MYCAKVFQIVFLSQNEDNSVVTVSATGVNLISTATKYILEYFLQCIRYILELLFTVYVIDRDMYIVHFDDKVKLSGQDGSFLTQACWVQNSELFPAEFIFWIANAFFTTHLRKKSLPIRDWFPKFANGLNIKIVIVPKVYKWPSCSFAKMILSWGDHFDKKTAWSLIYFMNYVYFDISLIRKFWESVSRIMVPSERWKFEFHTPIFKKVK